MEQRLRAACFYQEKEDDTSVTSVDSGPYGDTQARKNFSLRSTPRHPTGAPTSHRQGARKRTAVINSTAFLTWTPIFQGKCDLTLFGWKWHGDSQEVHLKMTWRLPNSSLRSFFPPQIIFLCVFIKRCTAYCRRHETYCSVTHFFRTWAAWRPFKGNSLIMQVLL